MATDATGVPTSLGIPKVDPDVDAPSGLGTNAAMDSIDTLLLARPSKPAGIVSGEAMVWNGASWDRSSVTRVGTTSLGSGTPDATKFLRGDGAWSVATQGPNKVTTSTMAGGPPASPSDADVWIATGTGANGERWAFQYNAGSASAFKWEFIGGTSVDNFIATSEATSSGSPVELTTSQILILSRAGDYVFDAGAVLAGNGGGNVNLSFFKNSTTDLGSPVTMNAVVGAGVITAMFGSRRFNGFAAGDTVRAKWAVSNATVTNISLRTFRVTPIRVS